jgi:hypothetical protein
MRRALIVLGMHRSGTSAVTGAAIRLGFAPPRSPLAPTQDNPTGFHEPSAVVALNDMFLRFLGCTWHDCLSFDPARVNDAARAAALDRCVAILRREFAHQPAFVVKDPQLCLTLPIWMPALRALASEISALLVVRHPDEVAKSVFRRDRLSESDTTAVWLHHMLAAERMTRGMPRAVVLYEDLLRDWRGCMARAGRIANIMWPIPVDHVRADAVDVVIRSLRHHVAGTGHVSVGRPPLRDLINDAWLALRQLADNPASISVHERLDHVRSYFVAWRH